MKKVLFGLLILFVLFKMGFAKGLLTQLHLRGW